MEVICLMCLAHAQPLSAEASRCLVALPPWLGCGGSSPGGGLMVEWNLVLFCMHPGALCRSHHPLCGQSSGIALKILLPEDG